MGLASLSRGKTVNGRECGATATVLAIDVDTDGRRWISTNRGLDVVGATKGTGSFAMRQLSPRESIPAQAYFSVLDDHGGFLWTCGNRGDVRLANGEIAELVARTRKSLQSTYFGRADGMATAQCSGASQPATCNAARQFCNSSAR